MAETTAGSMQQGLLLQRSDSLAAERSCQLAAQRHDQRSLCGRTEALKCSSASLRLLHPIRGPALITRQGSNVEA